MMRTSHRVWLVVGAATLLLPLVPRLMVDQDRLWSGEAQRGRLREIFAPTEEEVAKARERAVSFGRSPANASVIMGGSVLFLGAGLVAFIGVIAFFHIRLCRKEEAEKARLCGGDRGEPVGA